MFSLILETHQCSPFPSSETEYKATKIKTHLHSEDLRMHSILAGQCELATTCQ